MPRAGKLRFLIDENLHTDIPSFLQKEGHDVSRVPKGFKNGSVFRLALRSRRILLSGDKDFANLWLYPPKKTAGIIIVRIHPPSPHWVIPRLKALLLASAPKRLKGRLILLEPEGNRIA